MKKVPTIHELRKAGYKVRVTHIRKFFRFDPQTGKKRTFWAAFHSKKHAPLAKPEDIKECEEFFIDCKGGETVIDLTSPDGKSTTQGVSVCSEDDAYVKRKGIRRALGFAVSAMDKQKDVYFSLRKIFS